LVAKDLRRRLRSPLGLAIVLSFPVVFSLMLALAFGSRGDRVPRPHLLVEDLDGEFVSQFVVSGLRSEQLAKHFEVEPVGPEGRSRIEAGEASALLQLPHGFSEDLLRGRPVTLHLVRNPAQGILPEVTAQLAGVLAEVLGAASRALREPLATIEPWIGSASTEPGAEITDAGVALVAVQIKRTLDGAESLVSPPVITLEGFATASTMSTDDDDDDERPAGTSMIFLFVLPGISVYALFLVGDLGMRDVLTESTLGTLRRQLAAPLDVRLWLLGKACYAVSLCGLALVVLAIVAAAVLRRGVDPLGFALLAAALILAVTGTAALVYGLSGTERKGATLGSIIYLVLGFAGGSFIPVDSLPPTLRALAPVSPFYWGTTGFRQLLEVDASSGSIGKSALVLAAIGIVTLLAGMAALRARTTREVAA
jgi:ABC-2 type transport system permease protein